MNTYKAIVVDDHHLFRKGISLLLSSMPEFEQVFEATDGNNFLENLPNLSPDLVLMDIKMPGIGGAEATRRALKLFPELKIIAFSIFGEAQYYNLMLDAGVKGFVLKNSEPAELKNAARAVLEGRNYFSQELLMNLVENYRHPHAHTPVKLTERENQVLQQICQGYSNQEIAKKLFLSKRTVETHRANLLAKTGSKNSIQLVVFAIRNKLFKL